DMAVLLEAANQAPGSPLAAISLPQAGIDHVVVVGTGDNELTLGPGWFRDSDAPGLGNTLIAGHRTTHDAPFRHLDDVVAGDELSITLADGTVRSYRAVNPADFWPVERLESWGTVELLDGSAAAIVRDDAFWIAEPGDDSLADTLVFFACHPVESSKWRIAVAFVAA
ncbi:MAG: class E sortase, partial [Actinomycetia bacterium]|nr:class E sortase [Actinomycetes bacterium]